MTNRIYANQPMPKIDIESASKIWTDEERKAYEEFTDVLANMIIKYGHLLKDEND